MHLHRMIDYLGDLLSRAWLAYLDDAQFDPEAMLVDITFEEAPPEA